LAHYFLAALFDACRYVYGTTFPPVWPRFQVLFPTISTPHLFFYHLAALLSRPHANIPHVLVLAHPFQAAFSPSDIFTATSFSRTHLRGTSQPWFLPLPFFSLQSVRRPRTHFSNFFHVPGDLPLVCLRLGAIRSIV